MLFFPIGDEDNRPNSHAIMVTLLIAANVAIFVAEQQTAGADATAWEHMVRAYGATPAWLASHPERYWPTIFSSMFMHGGWMHLIGNMVFLWIFADNIEDLLGPLGFIVFYVSCGAVALLAHIAVNPHSTVPLVGASGAISGVMGAYILMFPRNRVRNFYWFYIVFGTVRVRAWLYLGFWFAMQLYLAWNDPGKGGGVAFAAHAGGFLAGMVGVTIFPKRREVLAYYRWKSMAS
jgi:membrane associated rhomboid family serine protease